MQRASSGTRTTRHWDKRRTARGDGTRRCKPRGREGRCAFEGEEHAPQAAAASCVAPKFHPLPAQRAAPPECRRPADMGGVVAGCSACICASVGSQQAAAQQSSLAAGQLWHHRRSSVLRLLFRPKSKQQRPLPPCLLLAASAVCRPTAPHPSKQPTDQQAGQIHVRPATHKAVAVDQHSLQRGSGWAVRGGGKPCLHSGRWAPGAPACIEAPNRPH
jgi:hypothetical protein